MREFHPFSEVQSYMGNLDQLEGSRKQLHGKQIVNKIQDLRYYRRDMHMQCSQQARVAMWVYSIDWKWQLLVHAERAVLPLELEQNSAGSLLRIEAESRSTISKIVGMRAHQVYSEFNRTDVWHSLRPTTDRRPAS